MKRYTYSLFAGVLLLVTMGACEEDPIVLGEDVIAGEPFGTGKAVYDVFAYNNNIQAVPTNRLPIYQLGIFRDPIYGNTEGRITTQVNLPNNIGSPIFGTISQTNEGVGDRIDENERLLTARLYLPFFLDGDADSDLDGVVDSEDLVPDDPNNDSDGDGLTNLEERATSTDPLNEDTDGDGIIDSEDEETAINIFPIRRQLDSIYGNRAADFTVRVERSDYFLSDLDPGSGFQDPSPNFSNLEVSPDFVSTVLADTVMTISPDEILTFQEDDPDTEADESALVDERLSPGLLIDLDPAFFQENILDMEGQPELLSNPNFREFLRGLHISLTPANQEELMILLDLTQARLTITYEYDALVDEEIEVRESSYELRLLTGGGNQAIGSNAVNTLVSDAYAADIENALASDENASRIYLKGGAGTFAELDLFEPESAENIINQLKQEDWIINAAYLVFHVDREMLDMAGPMEEPSRLLVYNAETLIPLYDIATERSTSGEASGAFVNYDGFLEAEGDRGVRYRVNITPHINDIIIRDSANVRLGLSITPDLRLNGTDAFVVGTSGEAEKELPTHAGITPLGTVLVGSNTEATDPQRLRLEIFYTEINP